MSGLIVGSVIMSGVHRLMVCTTCGDTGMTYHHEPGWRPCWEPCGECRVCPCGRRVLVGDGCDCEGAMHNVTYEGRTAKEAKRDAFDAYFGASAYDWFEAFFYAVGFDIEDLTSTRFLSDGQNDGDAWIGVFLLRDGRWAYLAAGCDYTGWDCQANGHSHICDTLDDLLLGFVGEEGAARLGLPMPVRP